MSAQQEPEFDPEISSVTPPTERRRARRSLIWLLRVLAVLIILLLIAIFYLQTGHALRHVILPRVAQTLHTKLDFSSGELSYAGRLALDNFSIDGSDGAPAFTSHQLRLRVDPRLLLGGKLVVREAQVDGAQLRFTVDPRGRSNWDFMTGGDSRAPATGTPPDPQLFPELHVDQLTINAMELLYDDGRGLQYHVQPLNLRARGLARGQTGQIELDVKGEGLQAAAQVRQTLELAFKGSLGQALAGEQLEWSGNLDTRVAQTRAAAYASSETQQVQLTGATSGRLHRDGRTSASLTLHAATPQGPVGDVDGAMRWEPRGTRQVDFTLRNIGPAALNPVLLAVGPLQFQSLALTGSGQLRGQGDNLELSLDLDGGNLSFKRGGAPATTPVRLLARQRLTGNLATRRLRVETFETNLSQGERRLLNTTLNQPAELDLSGGASAVNQAGAQLTLELNQIAWDDLKPWLILLGGNARDLLRDGQIDGKVVLDLERGGRRLALHGGVAASGLRITTLDAPPLRLNPEFSGTLVDFKTIEIARAETSCVVEGQTIASAGFKGRFRLDQREAAFTIDLASDQLTRLLDTLNGPADPPPNVSGGRLHTTQELTLSGEKQLIGLRGTLLLNDLGLRMAGGAAPLSAQGDLQLTIDQVKQLIRFERGSLNISAGRDTGQVNFSGSWPFGVAPNSRPAIDRAGSLKLELRRFDAAPWLALLGYLDADPLPSLPLEADEEISLAAGTLRVRGKARIGLPAGAATAAGSPQLLDVTHALEQAGNQLASLLLEIKGPDATLSSLNIQGSGQLGPAPRLDLTAKAGSLDLDALLARIDAILGNKRAPEETGSADAKSAPPRERPATLYDAKLEVEHLLWRGQELRDARLRARFEQGVWTVNVDQSQLNGGPFVGQLTYDGFRSEPRMAWDLNAQRTPIQKLLAIGDPAAAEKINGLADIRTRGAAEGSGEQLKRSLQGSTEFKIVDGELRQNRFLDALADQTLLGSFRAVKFFEFAGGLAMNSGKITFEKCLLSGPLHRIDVKGWVEMVSGKYQVTLIPAIGQSTLGSITDKLMLTSLVKDVAGFYQFPFGVTVRGEPGKFLVLPRVGSPINPGGVAGALTEGVVEGVNQGIGGTVELGRDVVGGVFRGAGRTLNTVTGGRMGSAERDQATTQSAKVTVPDAAAANLANDEASTRSQNLLGKTAGQVGGAVEKSTEKVKDGVEGVFRGVGRVLGK